MLGGWLALASVPLGAEPALLVFDAERGELSALFDTDLRACGARGDWGRCLRVEVAGELEDPPPVLGALREVGDRLVFEPRFGWDPDVRYRALLLDSDGAVRAGIEVVPSAVEQAATQVLGIEPAAEAVPANLLRFYVEFSAPMLGKEVGRHVRLLDEEGADIKDAFVEVPEGLWSGDRRRLTLFLHPGRIKRGVGPHEVLGPPLIAGRSYRLRIEPSLLDAAGRPLATPFEHPFRVVADDRQSPEPSAWRLHSPAMGKAPLVVRTDGPLDPVLARRLLRVLDAEDRRVEGELEVEGELLLFRPEAPWSPGTYRLEVDAALEDLAGNRPGRLFDLPTGARDEGVVAEPPGSLSRSFSVGVP